jgi:Bax protein
MVIMKFLKGYLSKTIKALFVIIFLAIVLLILSIPINYGVKKEKLSLLIEYKSIKKPSDILKINGKSVKPVIYEDISKFKDFPEISRKERYIETLLPAILVVRFNLLNEKSRTERLWAKIRSKEDLTSLDSGFINSMYKKYKTESLKEINQKQHLHPVSITLAQSILETGWGNSRFFLKGNNAFGIWSYNKLDNRMAASTSRDGLVIYLKKYDNVAQSVEDYFLTLANSWAFDEFRMRRYESDNPYELIWYLNKYSELRNDYVKKVGEIIVQNNLTKYDSCTLDKNNFIKVKL